ncbi:MAG: protein YgfX [Granulosicoccaceae bacterium]
MSFKQYAVPLQLDLRPSTWLRAAIAAVHGLVVAALFLSGVSHGAVALGLAATLVSLLSAQFWVRRPARLVWREDGLWQGTVWRNKLDNARLLPSTFNNPHIVILHFEEDTGTSWRIPVASDSVPDDTFRRLRVRLRASGNGTEQE